MGLIRMGLAVGTLGGVSPRSRKQRVAAASLRELKAQTRLLEEIADPGKAERERQERADRVAARLARRTAKMDARKARREQRAAAAPWVAPAWFTPTLRVLGWLWVAVFAVGSLSILGGLAGGWICLALAAVPAVLLYRSRRSAVA